MGVEVILREKPQHVVSLMLSAALGISPRRIVPLL